MRKPCSLAVSILALTVACGLLWACSKDKPVSMAQPERGEVVAAGCVFCHGPGGNSGSPLWPSLAGLDEEYIAGQIKAFRDGVAGLRRTPESAQMYEVARDLSTDDIQAIAAYYAASRRVERVPATDTDAGSALYFDGVKGDAATACATCHGEHGEGIADLHAPALRGQWTRYTVQQLKAYNDGSRVDPTGGMASVAAALDDADRLAVARYLEGLK